MGQWKVSQDGKSLECQFLRGGRAGSSLIRDTSMKDNRAGSQAALNSQYQSFANRPTNAFTHEARNRDLSANAALYRRDLPVESYRDHQAVHEFNVRRTSFGRGSPGRSYSPPRRVVQHEVRAPLPAPAFSHYE